MRKVVAISALSVLAAGSVAVGIQRMRAPSESMTADLERDLSLASTVQQTRSGVVSALEQGRMGAPSGDAKGQRMVVPTKKKAPSAAPSAMIAEAPVAPPTDAPQAAPNAPPDVNPTAQSVVAVASAVSTDVYPVPADNSYPTPAPASGGPSAGSGNEGDRGNGGAGRGEDGRRGGVGGVIGAILRGTTVGHDNCEPAGRRNGLPGGTGVLGTIGGIMAGGSGMPTGSIPGGPRSGGNRRW